MGGAGKAAGGGGKAVGGGGKVAGGGGKAAGDGGKAVGGGRKAVIGQGTAAAGGRAGGWGEATAGGGAGGGGNAVGSSGVGGGSGRRLCSRVRSEGSSPRLKRINSSQIPQHITIMKCPRRQDGQLSVQSIPPNKQDFSSSINSKGELNEQSFSLFYFLFFTFLVRSF